jgi:hypothetical protein
VPTNSAPTTAAQTATNATSRVSSRGSRSRSSAQSRTATPATTSAPAKSSGAGVVVSTGTPVMKPCTAVPSNVPLNSVQRSSRRSPKVRFAPGAGFSRAGRMLSSAM